MLPAFMLYGTICLGFGMVLGAVLTVGIIATRKD